ncbi:MAG: peptidase M61, partial [Planctomycetota bacterium]
ELFHAWNVKRMRPTEFWHYDYENENYTELLWLIEGWTAYYDDLLCLRAGLMTAADYLSAVGKSVNTMLTSPGRHRLSLRESSFDAWIRLYRPDENTRNSSQNYYVNGSVAALCLDLMTRRDSMGARSLDDVLRELYGWTFARGCGYGMQDVVDVVRRCSSQTTADALQVLVGENFEPDLQDLLAEFGVRLLARDGDRPQLGVNFESDSTKVASVLTDTAAHAAGVAPGDELLAVRGLRVNASNWQDVFQAVAKIDQPLELLLSRRGVITHCVAIPRRATGVFSLEIDEAATPQQQALRNGWLQQARGTAQPRPRPSANKNN